MAIGDQNDMFTRIKSNLVSWFGNAQAIAPDEYPDGIFTPSPVIDCLLMGVSATDAYIYSLIVYINLQTRIQTCTGTNLDFYSLDFFDGLLPRHDGESDAAFRNRIEAFLLQEKTTKQGMYQSLLKLTGIPPYIIEGFETTDNACLGNDPILHPGGSLFLNNYYYGGLGFTQPYTAIIYAFIKPPIINADKGVGGLNQNEYGGMFLNSGNNGPYVFNNALVTLDTINPDVTQADVLALIKVTKQAGTLMIVYINGVFVANV